MDLYERVKESISDQLLASTLDGTPVNEDAARRKAFLLELDRLLSTPETPGLCDLIDLETVWRELPNNSTGGCLHIVLDDGNVNDSHVQWCLSDALEQGDLAGVGFATLLARASIAVRWEMFRPGTTPPVYAFRKDAAKYLPIARRLVARVLGIDPGNLTSRRLESLALSLVPDLESLLGLTWREDDRVPSPMMDVCADEMAQRFLTTRGAQATKDDMLPWVLVAGQVSWAQHAVDRLWWKGRGEKAEALLEKLGKAARNAVRTYQLLAASKLGKVDTHRDPEAELPGVMADLTSVLRETGS